MSSNMPHQICDRKGEEGVTFYSKGVSSPSVSSSQVGKIKKRKRKMEISSWTSGSFFPSNRVLLSILSKSSHKYFFFLKSGAYEDCWALKVAF